MARADTPRSIRIGRPPVVRETIDGDLRRAIVEGRYAPGDQVPSVAELAARYKVSPTTVHEALINLAADGFVLARGRRGTFVVEHPPHLWRVAIVERYTRPQPHAEFRSLRIEALEQAALELARRDTRRQLDFFYEIDEEYDARESYHRLVHEVRSQKLAGLVFLESPKFLRDSELLRMPGVPRVTFWPGAGDLHVVLPDFASWAHKAVDLAAAKGRRRLAMVASSGDVSTANLVTAQARKRGIAAPSQWTQFINFRELDACRITELLFHPGQRHRPDVLLVSDDHFITGVMKGLAMAKVRPGQDVTVVAMFNYPKIVTVEQPIVYLGFDQRRALVDAIEVIDARRRGESPAARVTVARTLDELESSAAPRPAKR